MIDKTIYDFDKQIDRRNTDSHKWHEYPPEILPMWISDMDFMSPKPVVDALQERIQHGVFGYPLHPPKELCGLIIDKMDRNFGWKIKEEDFLFFPGTHDSFKLACRLIGKPGDDVLMHTPLYPPLLWAPEVVEKKCLTSALVQDQNGKYGYDFDNFQEVITPNTSLYILCNPHNPVGRVYTKPELEKISEICLKNNIVICSDDVHSELLFPGSYYTPIASIDQEIAERTITLIAPSKAYNIAGLKLSIAIVQNRKMWNLIRSQLDNYPASALGIVAGTAAYRDGGNWLSQMLIYIDENRQFLYKFVKEKLPGIKMSMPEGTYLAWLDCRDLNLSPSPFHYFLNKAKVALGNGESFGVGGEGFVRLNFACSRNLLNECLERMKNSIS